MPVKNYYVYMFLDPRKYYLPFYIGKGKGRRYRAHLSEKMEQATNKRKVGYIKKISLSNKGQIPWSKGISMSDEAKKKAFETKKKNGLVK